MHVQRRRVRDKALRISMISNKIALTPLELNHSYFEGAVELLGRRV